MSKQFRKILITGVMLIMCVVTLCACNSSSDDVSGIEEYHAVLYDNAINLFKDDFCATHTLEYDIVDKGNSFAIEGNEYVYLIKNSAEMENIFKDCQTEVNFDEQIMCVFVHVSTSAAYKLAGIVVSDDTLQIKYTEKDKAPVGAPSMTEPHLNYMVAVLDKLEIVNVEFIETK